jgi:hypothetical protein
MIQFDKWDIEYYCLFYNTLKIVWFNEQLSSAELMYRQMKQKDNYFHPVQTFTWTSEHLN